MEFKKADTAGADGFERVIAGAAAADNTRDGLAVSCRPRAYFMQERLSNALRFVRGQTEAK